jgi:DNA invertase Pin-like site-specific DNA recombinase
MLFAVLAVAAQLDRDYIKEKTLEGQRAAPARGNHGGRPKVVGDDMLIFARALRDKGVPVPEIAGKLTIKTGKNAGRHPSVASAYRALAGGLTRTPGAHWTADGAVTKVLGLARGWHLPDLAHAPPEVASCGVSR